VTTNEHGTEPFTIYIQRLQVYKLGEQRKGY
jgi:hypothetical protein